MSGNPFIFPSLKQPLTEVWFQPMGLKLRLLSNSPAIVEAAGESFGRFGPTNPVAAPDLIFHLFAHDLDDGRLDPPLFRRVGFSLYQTSGRDSTLVADLTNGSAYGYFSATTLANPAFFRWHFLELAFFQMLEAREWMGVHASAIARNGQALLLRAPSGGGKTTLAYAAARRSFQALAEDVVWLEPSGKRWWGMPWFFHLLPDAKTLFSELAPYQPKLETNGELKLEVDLERLRSGSTTVSAQPGPIVLVERIAGSRSHLEVISPSDTQTAWPIAQTGLEMQLPHHHSRLERLLSHSKTYRLFYGDDIEAALTLLESLYK